MENGVLKGSYVRRKRVGPVTLLFTAKPFQSPAPSTAKPAQFAGLWRLETEAKQGVRVMDGRFRQSGDQVTGTISGSMATLGRSAASRREPPDLDAFRRDPGDAC